MLGTFVDWPPAANDEDMLLQEQIARLKAAGEPLSLTDLADELDIRPEGR